MVRPYGIKVNKRKEREERYDKEEDEVEEQPKFEQKQKARESSKKAKKESTSRAEEDNDEEEVTVEATAAAEDIVGGIPIVLNAPNKEKSGIVFVLEKASLEVAKVGKTYQLLNSDDHANFLKKNNRNPADYRPDITHQVRVLKTVMSYLGSL
jgi:rRNA small subunit pseudouridine methyltransferase Nep1